MGADLYIKDMDRESQYRGFEVSQDAVDVGYFRDCYNSGGLFAIMGATLGETISWWQFSKEQDMFREDEEEGLLMTVKGVKIWKEKMIPLLKQFMNRKVLYRKEYVGKNFPHDWHNPKSHKKIRLEEKEVEEYHDWAKMLLNFIELAETHNSEIIWSV